MPTLIMVEWRRKTTFVLVISVAVYAFFKNVSDPPRLRHIASKREKQPSLWEPQARESCECVDHNKPNLRRETAITYSDRCSPQESEYISRHNPSENSNCPDSVAWTRKLLDLSQEKESVTLMSIGCNRGDDLLIRFREWSRNSSYSFNAIQDEYQVIFGSVMRACNLPAMLDPPVGPPRTARAFCVEPMISTFHAVHETFKKHDWDTSIHFINAAVSSVPGEAQFPISHAGMEALGLGMVSSDGAYTVNVTTIDKIVSDFQVDEIDMLSIDTEGNDARAILGAIHTLPIVRFLEFEYHWVGRWAQSDLQDIIDLLDQFMFDCYWQGNQGQLWKITGCWHDSYYQKRGWSNVGCVKRSETILHEYMEEIARRDIGTWNST